MKYVFSNGIRFEVRDISEPLVVVEQKESDSMGKIPLPIVIKNIVSDEEARQITKQMISNKNYRRTK